MTYKSKAKHTLHVKPSNIARRTIRYSYLDSKPNLLIPGDIYEFGVYSGVSVDNILEVYTKHNQKDIRIWGFDSFEGLPEETKDKNDAFYKSLWSEGEFSSCDYLDVDDPQKAAKIIEDQLKAKYPGFDIKMIIGFFCDSLSIDEKYKPASLIDIDVDIYTSAVEALDFCWNNKLFQVGTLIYYDDWAGEGFGESRAHFEFIRDKQLELNMIYSGPQRLYRVESINYETKEI